MKTLITLVLASVSFFTLAATGSHEVAVRNDAVKSPKNQPSSSHEMKADELREFTGQYVLDNSLILDILWKN